MNVRVGIWYLGSVKSWSEVYQLGKFGGEVGTHSKTKKEFVTLISAFGFALVLSSA